MKTIKLSKEQTEEFFRDEGDDQFTLETEGDWEQNGKYQHCYFIYKESVSGKYYRLNLYRSGSYHSDWYYSFEDEGSELVEVYKKEVIKHIWATVK